ncbi:MAG TPA: hypothetical protein RMH99_25675 [Sandaracinaceae bacterium LLY-WYZ-13_1]|nr:hypothetical protein [Sandaracinaceae bacterium LLY-WYZ-13_1]
MRPWGKRWWLLIALAMGCGGLVVEVSSDPASTPASSGGTQALLLGAAAEPIPPPTCRVGEHPCPDASADDCLEPVRVQSDDGAAAHTVYRWRDRDQWTDGGVLPLPHFLLSYVRSLRDEYGSAARGNERERTCRTQLEAQLEYLRDAAVERQGALVWENEDGLAQAMEQAEYAHLWASVAVTLLRHGEPEAARRHVHTALRFAAALDRSVGLHSGGVRSETTSCGDVAPARTCAWFHSRGLGIRTEGDEPRTVLNQHLHAVRDMLNLHRTLARAPELLPADEREAILRRILDRAAAGLAQLAFSDGWQPGAPRPPNAAQLMERFEEPAGTFYWATYEFDLESGRPRNISLQRTCHYHRHSLELLSHVQRWLADPPPRVDEDARRALRYPLERLLEGAGEPVGAPGSRHAFHQFFLSDTDPVLRRARGCRQPPLATDSPAYQSLAPRLQPARVRRAR